jgi:hypothetical protein
MLSDLGGLGDHEVSTSAPEFGRLAHPSAHLPR